MALTRPLRYGACHLVLLVRPRHATASRACRLRLLYTLSTLDRRDSRSPLLSAPRNRHCVHAIEPPVTLMTTQTRSHAGHGHGHHHHHHHHDNPYLLSQDKSDPGVRITRIGLLVNLAMAAGKFVGGYVFHSQALIADAYHAVTDMVSDIMTLGTVAWALKPPSDRFPLGYGKIESIGALGVSGLLLCGGLLMGLNAGQVLLAQFFPEAFEALAHAGFLLHGHDHGHAHGIQALGPNINAAWLAGGSIIVKEWLYRATMKIANERKSSVLASNAVHHRVDSLTSMVALVTIGGSHLLSNAAWLDPVGGLVISIMVVQAGWANTKASFLELADASVDEEIKESVHEAASRALAGRDVDLRAVQGIKSGQNYLMDIEVAVPGSWSVQQSREIETMLREKVSNSVRGVRRVRVRFIPRELEGVAFKDEFIPGDVTAARGLEHEHSEADHDHHHIDGHEDHHHHPPHNRDNGIHKRR
ncbi:hypothetical protein VTN49DRAFT_4496 [Thermomyces lanuginosus]|uniref:uncharacterized protein n=1 Tax=Thermomyces lanuginosus TaxID=5541 RepID=UPI003742D753